MGIKLSSKPVKNTEAKWFDYDEDTKVQLMSIDNPEYQIAMARLRRALNRNDATFQQGEIGIIEGEKTEHESLCLMLATYILKDWTGAEDADGNPLKYTPENGHAVLMGDTDLFLFIVKQANEYSAESKAELAESVGKQSPATNGKKSGAAKAKSAP